MKKVDKMASVLRAIAEDFQNGNDGMCFDICGECKSAADLIEQLDKDLNAHMQYNRNLRIIATNNETRIADYELKILKLQAENERLKVDQVAKERNE